MPQPTISSTTQNFLDIYDITNDLVILRNGTTTLIISVDAMNFGLLAEEEQDSIIYSYAGLLNSLNYPIQIIIDSQTKDVTGYLQLLKNQETETQNEKMRERIRQYRQFVANLIRERNVLDKRFYVAIPATSLELGLLTPQSVLPGSAELDISSIESSVILEKAQSILEPKRDHLIAQFARIGLYSRQLTTQEIIQLFYISYNPEAAEGQQLVDTSNYTAPLVSTGSEGFIMQDDTSQNNNLSSNDQAQAPSTNVGGSEDSYQPTQMSGDTGQPAQMESPVGNQTTGFSAPSAQASPNQPAAQPTRSTLGSSIEPITSPGPDLSSTMDSPPQITPELTDVLVPPTTAAEVGVVAPPTPVGETGQPRSTSTMMEQPQPSSSNPVMKPPVLGESANQASGVQYGTGSTTSQLGGVVSQNQPIPSGFASPGIMPGAQGQPEPQSQPGHQVQANSQGQTNEPVDELKTQEEIDQTLGQINPGQIQSEPAQNEPLSQPSPIPQNQPVGGGNEQNASENQQ